ncbi:unknown protein [Seminavis robusta]|uniref:Uncharacterized protein n=1 Tax=Seminavis robusta TaxID=568900 RepID=A0A9N8DUC7_9STRA|nr:unknown protein [Seminavis robusta]|eukprot:Sro297_g110870.1 n/a (201) ;mRNA; r:21917-22588
MCLHDSLTFPTQPRIPGFGVQPHLTIHNPVATMEEGAGFNGAGAQDNGGGEEVLLLTQDDVVDFVEETQNEMRPIRDGAFADWDTMDGDAGLRMPHEVQIVCESFRVKHLVMLLSWERVKRTLERSKQALVARGQDLEVELETIAILEEQIERVNHQVRHLRRAFNIANEMLGAANECVEGLNMNRYPIQPPELPGFGNN